jgi:predicted RNA-binding protein with PUA-like domain
VAVKVAAVRRLEKPVSLARMKAEPALAELQLIRQSRLSVVPVRPEEWDTILRLSEG